MKTLFVCCLSLVFLSSWAAAPAAPPALTGVNQNFAVVRDIVPLDLTKGANDVRFTGTGCAQGGREKED